MSGLTDYSSRETLTVMAMEYTMERDGHRIPEPVVQLFCRDADGNRRYVEVDGFYPHFYISESEYRDVEDQLLNETALRSIEARSAVVSDEHSMNTAITEVDDAPAETLEGERLVKLYTVEPKDVGDVRETFERTWEADVFFTDRFCITNEIYRSLTVPEGDERVSVDDVEPADETLDVSPRVLTIDIEVWSGDTFPDTEEAAKPITSFTMHDSYEDKYVAGILDPSSTGRKREKEWEDDIAWKIPDGISRDQIEIEVFDDEAEMLAEANAWIKTMDPDILTGWNSSRNDIGNGFDWPYWINRCQRINVWSISEISPLNQAFTTKSGTPHVKGRVMLDMLQAYKKTQIHKKRSYSLGYIADDELGYGKEDIDDIDEGWLTEPAEFMRYNIRDVSAVVEIEEAKSVLEIYDHIRSITGVSYSEIAESNIGIIDVLFLRSALQQGYALPTSERPDVQHYWGAYVFPPEPGKHENVVYPDLSSLYPNLFRDMNASPETIVGDADALQESQYSEDDCHVVYVDLRDEDEKKEADEPEREELYVLKPQVQQSFVREIVQDLIDMKYQYKSDEYSDEAYGAIKRITNSVYGVMGDSVSYGKGFRLFDWRIAEAITLAGRDVIKHTASEFESRVQDEGYDDATIIAGDTDSCVCEVPSADGLEETLDVAMRAAEYVDATYDEFMMDRYNMDRNNMAVEIESYAEAALFMNKKKRYAQWIRWDEGDEVDEVEYKGFELVRSDSAEATSTVQKAVIDRILQEDTPRDSVSTYLKTHWEEASSGTGRYGPSEIGIPSALSKPPEEYGGPNKNGNYTTPQPQIRGAKYATAHIDGENITSGDKPLMFYVNRVNYPYPDVYVYGEWTPGQQVSSDPTQKEVGRDVDAISLNDVDNLPEQIHIDYEKMAEKTIKDPVKPITDVMGWSWENLLSDSSQSGLAAYM